MQQRARELAAGSGRRSSGPGITLDPLNPTGAESAITYSAVSLAFNREKRTADLTVHAPSGPQPSTPDEILKAGDQFWPLRAFRELDDALLRLRVNEPEIGTIVIRTEGDCSTSGRAVSSRQSSQKSKCVTSIAIVSAIITTTVIHATML